MMNELFSAAGNGARARSTVLGMDVLSIREGIVLGQIKQVLIDSATYRVQGFLVEKRRGGEERILPFGAVNSFGEDGVTVQNQAALERRGINHQYIRTLRHPLSVIGARVFTANGRTLGKVEEYFFSVTDGTLTALELSGGMFREHTLVPGCHIIAISPQTIMMKDVAEEEAAATGNSFRAGVENTAEAVRDQAKKLSANIGGAVRGLWDKNNVAPAEIEENTAAADIDTTKETADAQYELTEHVTEETEPEKTTETDNKPCETYA